MKVHGVTHRAHPSGWHVTDWFRQQGKSRHANVGSGAQPQSRIRTVVRLPRLLIALALVSTISAVGGGIALVVARSGDEFVPLELLEHTPFAGSWTALAWAAALPFSFAPAPFVDESTPVSSHLLLWGSGGLLMAYVMALITWRGVLRVSGQS
jgi:hypothetical protein